MNFLIILQQRQNVHIYKHSSYFCNKALFQIKGHMSKEQRLGCLLNPIKFKLAFPELSVDRLVESNTLFDLTTPRFKQSSRI